MKAVRAGAGEVQVVDVDEPPGTGELIRMRSASICGSDFGYLAAGSTFILGHELAGTTADGRAVAVEALYGCMACEQCRRGRHNLCPQAGAGALGLSADGGMVEQFRVPARHLVDLPPGLDVADGSLVEPAAVAWHGFRLADPAGRRVAVVGGGSIGLMAAAAARAAGAAEVGLDARHPRQAEVGERLGATPVTGLYDVVVEAAGTPSAVARSIDLAAPGGSVVILGVHAAGFEPPFLPMFMKEVRIVPSMAYCGEAGDRDVDRAAAMLAADPGIAEALVTHRFPLEDAAEAFRVAADRAAGAIKVVIEI